MTNLYKLVLSPQTEAVHSHPISMENRVVHGIALYLSVTLLLSSVAVTLLEFTMTDSLFLLKHILQKGAWDIH